MNENAITYTVQGKSGDREADALAAGVLLLEQLKREEAHRVARYLSERFGPADPFGWSQPEDGF